MTTLMSTGRCPTCMCDATFFAKDGNLRQHYRCSNCGSVPRERALMEVIERYYPGWRDLVIHESSPGPRGASPALKKLCGRYLPSQFFPDCPVGSNRDGVRCENLEALSFEDESIDLHVTQDVMEHVFNPAMAFSEIARTLKPGGAHIFTVPLVMGREPSRRRARVGADGSIHHLLDAQYHGNPVSSSGSLVTVDWGFDICRHIHRACGLFTTLVSIDDLSKGIRARFNEVLVTFKPLARDGDSI